MSADGGLLRQHFFSHPCLSLGPHAEGSGGTGRERNRYPTRHQRFSTSRLVPDPDSGPTPWPCGLSAFGNTDERSRATPARVAERHHLSPEQSPRPARLHRPAHQPRVLSPYDGTEAVRCGEPVAVGVCGGVCGAHESGDSDFVASRCTDHAVNKPPKGSSRPLPAERHHQKLVFPSNYTMCSGPRHHSSYPYTALVLLPAITVTYRRSPGPPLGRLVSSREDSQWESTICCWP